MAHVSVKRGMFTLKSFAKKLKLGTGSKLTLASKLTERMPSRVNLIARDGVRPGVSGRSKLASDIRSNAVDSLPNTPVY